MGEVEKREEEEVKTTYDLSKAEATVNEYAAAISDPTQLPGKHNRTWLEFCMKRNGLIPDVRHLAFGESHALWYACLVITGRVNEISRLERDTNHAPPSRTTNLTIRKMLSEKWSPLRDSLTAQLLREILTAHNDQKMKSVTVPLPETDS